MTQNSFGNFFFRNSVHIKAKFANTPVRRKQLYLWAWEGGRKDIGVNYRPPVEEAGEEKKEGKIGL